MTSTGHRREQGDLLYEEPKRVPVRGLAVSCLGEPFG
jgi:hypothetical protein